MELLVGQLVSVTCSMSTSMAVVSFCRSFVSWINSQLISFSPSGIVSDGTVFSSKIASSDLREGSVVPEDSCAAGDLPQPAVSPRHTVRPQITESVFLFIFFLS